jgi:hypothetical protein
MDDYIGFPITSFRGGISEHGNKGPKGSFKFGYGLNIREGEDTLKCNQALKKDSGTTVTDLVLTLVAGSDGNIYGFGDTGKIYRKAGGTWTLVYTDAGGKITGAAEFASTSGRYILYATQTKLRKISLANAGGTWTGNVSDAGTFSEGASTTLHTMTPALGVLLINDGNLLAMYDYADAFNATALRLSSGKVSNALIPRGNRIYIGTSGQGWVIDWDRLQDSWLSEKSAQGRGVNMMGFLELGIIMQVGSEGNLKYFNLSETSPFKVIPGTGTSRPGAVCEYKSITHFGMNGGTKNGIYSVGRFDKNDPISVNLEYIPSHGKLTGTEIGALCSDGTYLYASWKDGTSYGIDVIDTANKANAVYESLEFNAGHPDIEKLFRHIKVLNRILPEGCEIKAKYKVTGSDDWVETETSESGVDSVAEGAVKGIFNLEGQGETYEVRIELYPNGNVSPEVLSIISLFTYDNSL